MDSADYIILPMPAVNTRIIAHRGAKHSRPENTFAAFDEALVENADGIELDIRLTRDGIPAIFHDHTLRKLGLTHRRFSDLGLAELQALDFGGWFDTRFRGERMPTLAQVLERYCGRTELSLELKTARDASRNAELVEKTVRLVEQAGVGESVCILCFDAGMLRMTHALAPALRCVLNSLGYHAALREAQRMPWLFGVDVDIRWLTPEAGDALREGGRQLMSYTCNTEQHLRCALAAGVHSVITNRPAWARKKVKESP